MPLLIDITADLTYVLCWILNGIRVSHKSHFHQGDGLEYALALRSAVVYVIGICSVPLLFPCRESPEVRQAVICFGFQLFESASTSPQEKYKHSVEVEAFIFFWEAALSSWATCPKSPYSFIPTKLGIEFLLQPFSVWTYVFCLIHCGSLFAKEPDAYFPLPAVLDT